MNTALKREDPRGNYSALNPDNTLAWTRKNSRGALLIGGLAVVLILVLSAAYALYAHRTASAQTAFGEAMQVYQTPIARPGQQVPPGIKTFSSAKERAQKANGLFAQVAGQYGMTEPGKLAHYFEGLTFVDEGQNGSAEDVFKQVASSWNGDIAALGKAALAQLYGETNRSGQAVELYQELAKGHATTVPPYLAQLQLADLYTAEGKNEQARQVYAEIKDHDKDGKGKPGIAAQVASQKLNPTAPARPGAR